jgi:hypothetical protein
VVTSPPSLSSAVVSFIDGEAAAMGIIELKPKSDAATSRNEVIPATLIFVLIDFNKEFPDKMSVKHFSLMLGYWSG